ncbi:hypothetical protein CsSME_00047990 [Camellia sinensis var. sinensis]
MTLRLIVWQAEEVLGEHAHRHDTRWTLPHVQTCLIFTKFLDLKANFFVKRRRGKEVKIKLNAVREIQNRAELKLKPEIGTGVYDKFFGEGVYTCAGCGTPLYRSTTKFNSGCGWPAFYEGLPGAINCNVSSCSSYYDGKQRSNGKRFS